MPLFTDAEVRSLVERRVPDASADEIAALQTPSGRNPRGLENLIATGRPFDPVSFPDAPGESHTICSTRCFASVWPTRAKRHARGAGDADTDCLLTGIALLAPPSGRAR